MRVGCVILTGILILGCDRAPDAASPGPAAEAALAPTPTSAPAATLPTSSTFTIDQRSYEFPPVRLEAEMRGVELAIELMSDVPPGVNEDSNPANSLFLPMAVEMPAGELLDGAKWAFKASNSERSETIAGIDLRAERKVLQPYDVVVTIKGDAPVVGVGIQGVFLLFNDADPQAPPRKVDVTAGLLAPVRWRGEMPATRPDSGAAQF